MKIGDTVSIRASQALKRRTGASAAAGGFESLLDTATAPEAAPVTDAAGIGSVDSMLALQSVSDEEVRRRQAVREGHSMLDALEGLRRSLLAGAIPPSVIRELDVRLSRQRVGVSDPRLLALIDDIELRVAVEKAKLEQALKENIPPGSA